MLLVSTFASSGCGGSSAPAPALLALSDETTSKIPECHPMSTHTEAPLVSRCATSSGPLFVTAMRQCGVPDKFSYQATTRQLLVGITGLEFIDQSPVSIDGTKALRSTFRGVLDADTILGATFTQRNGDCITDLIIWRATSSALHSPEQIESFTQAATEVASKVRTDQLLAREG
jgi:hypothetical protein